MLKTLAFLPVITASIAATPTAVAQPVDQTTEQAELPSKFIQKTESEILLDVPYVNQFDGLAEKEYAWAGGSACGPTSLNMVINDKGKTYSLQTIINRLPSNVYIKGAMFYNLSAGPELFGFKAHEIEISAKEIYETLAEGHPIVMNIQNYDGIVGHAIVVVGIKGYNAETQTAESLNRARPPQSALQNIRIHQRNTLRQEEGWINPIGIIKPFYVIDYSLAAAVNVE